MDGPTKDIVNHQRVNVWLMLLRATGAGADEKSARISAEVEAMPERPEQCPMRQVAHFCVSFASLLRLKDAEIAAFDAFLAENQRLNRRPGQADRGGLSRQRASVTGSEPIIRSRGPAPPAGFTLSSRPPRHAARRFSARNGQSASLPSSRSTSPFVPARLPLPPGDSR